MATVPQGVITGNMTRDIDEDRDTFNIDNPEKARVRISLAVNRRDRDGNELDPQFFDVTVFGYRAVNLFNSAGKGTRITAEVKLNTYKKEVFDEDGEAYDLTMIGLTASSVSIDLEFATVTVKAKKAARDDDDFKRDEEKPKTRTSRTSRTSRSSSKDEAADDNGGDDSGETRSSRSSRASRNDDEGKDDAPARSTRSSRSSRNDDEGNGDDQGQDDAPARSTRSSRTARSGSGARRF